MKWHCIPCEYIYDEAKGIPDEGIEPGTPFADLPEDWVCPNCGIGKEGFEPLKEGDDEVVKLSGSGW